MREDGVTPVVGTIMLVAIAVITAAVIYLMAFSYLTTPYSTAQLLCTLTMEPRNSNSTDIFFTVEMSKPSESNVDMVKIGVFHDGTYTMLNYSPQQKVWSNYTGGAKWYYEAIFHDNNANGKFDSGDEIEIKLLGTGHPAFSSGDSIRLSVAGYNGVATGWINL